MAERSAAEQARRQARADPAAADGPRRRRRAARARAGRGRVRRGAVGPRGSRTQPRPRQAAVSADARRVGARSQLTDDISLSLLLAAAGARLDDSPETRVNLLTALAKQPHLVRSAPPGGGFLEAMDVSPDGRWIASSDDQNRMHLYDAATNRLLRSYDAGRPPEDEQAWMIAAFSPDSSQLAVILEGGSPPSRCACWTRTPCEPTTRLDIPGGRAGLGDRCPVQCRRRYLAATVQTVNPGQGCPVGSGLRGGLGPALPVHAPRPGADRHGRPRGWRSARTARPCTPASR